MLKRKILGVVFLVLGIGGFAQNNDADMERILQQRRDYNLKNSDNEGYRIQIYNGLSESEARNVQARFVSMYSELPAYLTYLTPEWKVQVGNFKEILDVYKYMDRIKRDFPRAVKINSKIKL